jgi:hypothetical protein
MTVPKLPKKEKFDAVSKPNEVADWLTCFDVSHYSSRRNGGGVGEAKIVHGHF